MPVATVHSLGVSVCVFLQRASSPSVSCQVIKQCFLRRREAFKTEVGRRSNRVCRSAKGHITTPLQAQRYVSRVGAC